MLNCSRFALLSLLPFLAACQIMPAQGPTGQTVASGAAIVVQPEGDASANAVSYVYVPVDNKILELVGSGGIGPRFAGRLVDRRPPQELTVGAGDVVSISIFEAAPGGLFTPPVSAGARPGNYVDLPAQTVGRDGSISIPYAGTIRVAGLTPNQIARNIESRLRNRAIEPQVVLTIREQRANQASVLGEVNQGTKVTLNPQGERVLDLIARAGGPRFPVYETVVSIQRGGQKAQVSMSTLIKEPSNNIYVQPGDLIYVSREQRHYVVLGASGTNGIHHFDSDSVTLSYALGKAGGLLDERADPTSVFVYRLETPQQLKKYGIDVSSFKTSLVPTIYALNVRDPSGLFLAQNWSVRDRDVIYVANAQSVEITKVLQFLRVGINTVREGAAIREPYVR